ncbi:hypothetical protein [Rheinheimera maricola]|uniref:Uncharacterized protein n=1 Tax=Rheinheimera maricola TaxID=2793282 RepID=A0ABS7XC17_9GAMM|nr:hypothetical protein [Rheinheimera maricola]MBZ9612167.1 hypothetical protein [Rheinheimera maricola]
MFSTITNPVKKLPQGCVFSIKQHPNPPAAAAGAKQQQGVNQSAYLANINFLGWPPFCYTGYTQPAEQLFSYFQTVRVWLDSRNFISLHSDHCLAFDGTSVGGRAIPVHQIFWKNFSWGAF